MRKQARHGGAGRNPSEHSGGKCRRGATSLRPAWSPIRFQVNQGFKATPCLKTHARKPEGHPAVWWLTLGKTVEIHTH